METGDEANGSHYSDVARSLSHLSLEDDNLNQVYDNSLRWEDDAPEGEFNLNNHAIFQTPSDSPNNVLSAYPLIPNFLLPPESSNHDNHDPSHIPSFLISHSEVFPPKLENMPIYVRTGKGSKHSIVISHMPHPLEAHRDFWTVGEIVKHVTSPHEERPNVNV